MNANHEIDNRTEFFKWVRENLPAIDLESLESRLKTIDLNEPISPQIAFGLIDEPELKSFMRKGQRIPGLIQKKGNIFRVSLFSALCSLPLTKPVFDCLIQHQAAVSKITGATSPLSLAIYGNQSAVANFLLEQKTKLNFDPGYNQTTTNLQMTQQLRSVTQRLGALRSDLQTQLGLLSGGLFGPGAFQEPPEPQADQNIDLELELATDDLPLCEPHLQLCAKLNRSAVFEAIVKHPHFVFNQPADGPKLVTYVCHPQWQHSSIPYLTALKERGVPLDTLSAEGQTPLHLAIIGLRTENVQWLLRNGANAFIRLSDEDLLKLLKIDAEDLSTSKMSQASFFNADGPKNEIKAIVRAHKKAVLALCKAAQSKDPVQLEAHLQTLGANHHLVNAPYCNNGKTAIPLDYAISSGDEQCVRLMIQHGADQNQISSSSRTQLAKMKLNDAAEHKPE